jgi:acyl-CoA oxidase
MARTQFLLTEVGHGLDARNLETTVTLLPNGDLDLHTPNQNAAK